MPFFSARVPEDFFGSERLDKYVSSLPNAFNRSKLKVGVHEILLNGKRAKLSSKVRSGDQIDIQWEDNIPDDIKPENIPLKIIFENKDVTVVNKEQGMVTHPAAGNWNGTLVNALLYHWGHSALAQIKEGSPAKIIAARRPGIAHRLDKDTSGVIITAKNPESEEWLCEQFRRRSLVKEYILITRASPPRRDGVVITQIVRDSSNRKRFKAVEEGDGKRAVTLYHVVAVYGNYTLIRVRLKTGRTHQIRVHMKYLGCPILGDPLYSKKDAQFPNAKLMLHSRLLKIRLPNQERFTVFKAAVPARFKEVIKSLKRTPRSYASKSLASAEKARAH